MQYRLKHQLGLDDAKRCVNDFGATLTLEAKELDRGKIIELNDKSYAYLTLPKPRGRGHVGLLEPVNVKGQSKQPEVTAPAK
jgi:hypothetical protein